MNNIIPITLLVLATYLLVSLIFRKHKDFNEFDNLAVELFKKLMFAILIVLALLMLQASFNNYGFVPKWNFERIIFLITGLIVVYFTFKLKSYNSKSTIILRVFLGLLIIGWNPLIPFIIRSLVNNHEIFISSILKIVLLYFGMLLVFFAIVYLQLKKKKELGLIK